MKYLNLYENFDFNEDDFDEEEFDEKNPLTDKEYDELNHSAMKLYNESDPVLRLGQCYMTVLYEISPKVYDKILMTDIDPFYNNNNLTGFFDYLSGNIDKPKNENFDFNDEDFDFEEEPYYGDKFNRVLDDMKKDVITPSTPSIILLYENELDKFNKFCEENNIKPFDKLSLYFKNERTDQLFIFFKPYHNHQMPWLHKYKYGCTYAKDEKRTFSTREYPYSVIYENFDFNDWDDEEEYMSRRRRNNII